MGSDQKEGKLYSEKVQKCKSHFDNGVFNGTISNLKWGKILVMIMGFTNASGQGHFELKSQQFQEYGDHLELDI